MVAKHRGKPDNSTPVALLAIAVVLGALIWIGFHLSGTHLSVLWLLTWVADAALVLQAGHRLVLNLANRQRLSAEETVDRLDLVAQLIAAVAVALAAIGTARGWMHGLFWGVMVCVLVLYLIGSPIYWLGGKRRLIAFLRTRTADDEPS